jgi:hypothetical protein
MRRTEKYAAVTRDEGNPPKVDKRSRWAFSNSLFYIMGACRLPNQNEAALILFLAHLMVMIDIQKWTIKQTEAGVCHSHVVMAYGD